MKARRLLWIVIGLTLVGILVVVAIRSPFRPPNSVLIEDLSKQDPPFWLYRVEVLDQPAADRLRNWAFNASSTSAYEASPFQLKVSGPVALVLISREDQAGTRALDFVPGKYLVGINVHPWTSENFWEGLWTRISP